MDDYFQIIIYLIIIFAFLNSLFRKKNKGEAPPRSANSRNTEKDNTNPASGYAQNEKQSEYDILKEIEGLFKGENNSTGRRRMESEIEKAKMRKVPRKEHVEDEEWHSLDKESHEQSADEIQLNRSWHSITPFKRAPAVDSVIEKEAEKFERMLAERNKEAVFPLNELREKLYSPGTLQDYIVVSEIIGKPKYLRR